VVVARGLRTLAAVEVSFALLAVAMPGLFTWQQLREHVRLSCSRCALVALASVTGAAVGAIELDA
jgi:undecaprenyl pyrophosphate phosphatase UppP